MRRKTYFTSDQHFNHNNIIRYCDRPFNDVGEMNDHIISEYNKIVKDNDIVYFLGDIGNKIKNIVPRLKGKKILILGNHDRESTSVYYDCGFQSVLNSATISTSKNRFFLNHIPSRTIKQLLSLFLVYIKNMRKRGRSWKMVYQRLRREWGSHNSIKHMWTICGHVHNSWKIKDKNINVGVDIWNFKPVNIDQIIVEINKNNT